VAVLSESTAFEVVDQAVALVRARAGHAFETPHVGIVLGSGLSEISRRLQVTCRVPYGDVPGMPEVSVVGHEGALYLGRLGGVPVVCASGRIHLYEGHSPAQVVHTVRLMASLGIEIAILTNAAGGIHRDFGPGTLMTISDHLNLTGRTPLLGPNARGPRFPDMSQAYDLALQELARRIATRQSTPLATGIYAGVLGPSYETPAEIDMLETMGASAVGMSTVLETLALRHLGVRVLGLSCITNLAAGRSAAMLDHRDVAEVALRASTAFSELVQGIVSELGAGGSPPPLDA
jgi:purine-nucleoside phosphorylase